ncbi:MAG: hypothetical protein QNJ82_17890 [Gammaproteobacteria bacterium]|nr:hypothetical protein [Gammaproteobacteria bacterium]
MDSKPVVALIIALGQAVRRLLRPARSAAKLMVGAAGDLTRTRSELMAENALLRQQLIVLRRSVERPRLHRDDRVLLLALARLTRRWRDALHVVSPETLLRWHRDLFKIVSGWRTHLSSSAALVHFSRIVGSGVLVDFSLNQSLEMKGCIISPKFSLICVLYYR